MVKKKRTDTIPKLVKKLDAVFSRCLRLKHAKAGKVKCYTCPHVGEVKTMQAGHYVPRQHKSVRWNEMNVKPQCYACNLRYGGRPQEFREQLIREYSKEEVASLEKKRHECGPLDRTWLKEQIEHYKQLEEDLDA